jgi:hypothetical protein
MGRSRTSISIYAGISARAMVYTLAVFFVLMCFHHCARIDYVDEETMEQVLSDE